MGSTSTQDHTSAHKQDGDMTVAAGQKFVVLLVTARNPKSHVPETPNPMIRAITAARMIMTVVILFGNKKKGQRYHTAHLFHSLHLQCMSAEPAAGKRPRQVPQT